MMGDPKVPGSTPLVLGLGTRNAPVVSRVRFTKHCASTGVIYVAKSGKGAAAADLVCRVFGDTKLGIKLTKGVKGDLTLRMTRNGRSCCMVRLDSFRLSGVCRFHTGVTILVGVAPSRLSHCSRYVRGCVSTGFHVARGRARSSTFVF